MAIYERLGVLAMAVGAGAVCTVGAVYLRPAAAPSPAAPTTQAQQLVPQPVRTVAWFKAHRDEMKSKYDACRNNPGLGQIDPECQNVYAAKQSTDLDDVIARYEGAPKK